MPRTFQKHIGLTPKGGNGRIATTSGDNQRRQPAATMNDANERRPSLNIRRIRVCDVYRSTWTRTIDESVMLRPAIRRY
jgi:hypothetical protein